MAAQMTANATAGSVSWVKASELLFGGFESVCRKNMQPGCQVEHANGGAA